MSSLEAIFVPVTGEAYHSVVGQLAAAAKGRPRLRCLGLAEFSPPHPWLKLAAPAAEIPQLGRELSESLGVVVLALAVQTVSGAFGYWRYDSGRTLRALEFGLEGTEDRRWSRRDGSAEPWETGLVGGDLDAAEAASAVFRSYDLPRFSDHRLRIGPAWPFRRFEACW